MEGLRLLDESSRDGGGEPESAATPAAEGMPVTAPSPAPPARRGDDEEDVLLDG